MTIEKIVEIQNDHRISLELPSSVPIGVMARVKIDIPAVSEKNINDSTLKPSSDIEEVRQLLQKEMANKGTSSIITASGDGWEAYVMEHHAKS